MPSMSQKRKVLKSQTKRSRSTSKQSLNEIETPESSGVFSLPASTASSLDVEGEDDVPLNQKEYEDRYVAFIDILGFREIVKHSLREQPEESVSSLNSIFNALNLRFQGTAEDYASQYGGSDSDLRVNTFSDFVVISSKSTEAGLDLLIFAVWCVTRDWLSKGYLSRGGIAKGPVIHAEAEGKTPGLVFGPAFIDAYAHEQEVADFPRVVFTKEVRTDLVQYRKDGNNTIAAIKTLVTKCQDGPMSIDMFGHLRRNGFEFLGKDHKEEAVQFQRTLVNQLEHGADLPRWYRKTIWLVQRFNEAISDTDYAGKKVQIDR